MKKFKIKVKKWLEIRGLIEHLLKIEYSKNIDVRYVFRKDDTYYINIYGENVKIGANEKLTIYVK